MKSKIKKSDFSFLPHGFGHYLVTYTSSVTYRTWEKVIGDMVLLDKTKNQEKPKKKDLEFLKYLVKQAKMKRRKTKRKLVISEESLREHLERGYITHEEYNQIKKEQK